MKIIKLRKKIIISFILSVIFAAILGAIIFIDIYEKKSSAQTIAKIRSDIARIKDKSNELKTKAIEIKKYITMWSEIDSDKKQLSKIDKKTLDSILKNTVRKYYIAAPELTISETTIVNGGAFNSVTLNTNLATVNLTFKSIDDIKALLFIDEFIHSIPGYAIVSDIHISKDELYNVKDLIAITSGQANGKIKVEVNFFWYAFSQKENLEE